MESGMFARGMLLATLALQATAAQADEEAAFELRGFGTLGAVYHDTPGGVMYRRDISQSADHAARAGHVSFGQDSMLGVQGTLPLAAELEVSAQVVSRMDVDGSYDPQLTMGYLKYVASDSFVRLGRMTIETYLKGDAAEVGYANLQVRQPVLIYPRTFDGVDAETTRPLGDGLLRAKAMVGYTTGKLANPGAASYDTAGSSGTGAFVEYSRSGWTLRGAWYSLKMKNELEELKPGGLLNSLLAGAPNATDVFNRITMKDRRITSEMLALEYDREALQGELGYTWTRSHDWSTSRVFHAAMGYRIEQATPYLSYASSRHAREYALAYPAGMSPMTDQVNEALLQTQAGMLSNETSVALGVRYDFSKGKALKFQYDRIRYQDPGSIADPGLSTTAAGARGYKTMNLYSVALDFVF